MTEAIVWLVIWLVLTGAGSWLIMALMTLAGVGVAGAIDAAWLAFVFAVIGWTGAIAWFIFAAVHVVLQVIDVVQLATA